MPTKLKSSFPYKHSQLTEQIIRTFYDVYNELGSGFLEKVYENALSSELSNRGLKVVQQHPIKVYYRATIVGEFIADLIVNDLVIVEVKAIQTLNDDHEAQLLNYLKATPFEVGLLLNFGPVPQKIRRAYENSRKEWWIKQNRIEVGRADP